MTNLAIKNGNRGNEFFYKNMLFGTAILKEIVHDPHTGKNMASVFRGNFRNLF